MLVRVLEGQQASPEALASLRSDGRLLARLQHECVLRIEQTSGVAGSLALVHENFDCVSMERVIDALRARGQVLPSRVAVEIAASVGIAIEEALKINDGDRRLIHGSPTPAEVLVDTAGRVKLAGFSVIQAEKWPPARPGYAAPEGPGGWQASTWMVGALLVELLIGEAPPDGSADPERHEQALRRLVMRLLARPGDTPGEPLVQAVRQALARDPESRGTPGAFGRMLRDIAVQLHTPGLRAWAPGTIPAVQRQAAGRAGAAPESTSPTASLPEPPLSPRLVGLPVIPAGDGDEPEATVVDIPSPPFAARPSPAPSPVPRAVPVAPPPSPAVNSPRVQSPGETRAVPVGPSVARPEGPSVTARSGARPLGPSVGSGPAPVAPPSTFELPSADDESEQTVVARPYKREEPAPVRVDPLAAPLIASAPPVGKAPVARPATMPLDEEELTGRSVLPVVLGGLTALFAAGSVILVAAIAWFYTDAAPEEERVPGLADVVGEPVSEPAPVAPRPVAEPAPVVAPPPVAEPAPVVAPVPAAPPAPAPAPVAAPAPKPAAPAPTRPAPAPAAKPAAAVNPAPSAKPAEAAPETDDAPVRIAASGKPAPAPAPAATPAPAPAPAPTAPAPAPVDAGPFAVTFTAADPGWSLEVKCIEGGGTGATVSIPAATRGNCRVVGRLDATTVMTLVTVTGSRDYSCFAGGTRVCR